MKTLAERCTRALSAALVGGINVDRLPSAYMIEWRQSADPALSYVTRADTAGEAAAIIENKARKAFLGEFRLTLGDRSICWTNAAACQGWDVGSAISPPLVLTVWQREEDRAVSRARNSAILTKLIRRAQDRRLLSHHHSREIIILIREAFSAGTQH